jgi:hypothetical protein
MLPNGWSSYSPAQKISWFNSVGATVEELSNAGVPQADINYMLSAGFTPGSTQNDTSVDPHIAELYTRYLGRNADLQGGNFYEREFGASVDENELRRFLQGAVDAGESLTSAGQQFLTGNTDQFPWFNPADAGNTIQSKAQYYNQLRAAGYSEQQIRNAADAELGFQTNTDWSALTGAAANLINTGTTGTTGTTNTTETTTNTTNTTGTTGTTRPAIIFPANILTMTQAEKQAYFNGLRTNGYTDAEIRAAANAKFGIQSDDDWNALTGKTTTQTTVTQPTGTQLLSGLNQALTAAAGESRIDPTISPYLQEALGIARGLFTQTGGPQLYPGQMYVSPSQQTLAALSAQEAIARSPNAALIGAQGAFLQGLNAPVYGQENLQNLYNLGATQPGLSAYQRAMAGEFTPQTAGLQQVAQGFGDVAGGSFLTGSPYQERFIEQSTRPITEQFLQQTLPALSSQFSAAGRYGSGAQERAIGKATEAAARAVGDIATQIGQQTYTQERGFQEAARGAQAGILGQIAGLQQTGFGNILAGASGLQGAQAQQFGQQMGAAQALANAQQQSLATRLGTAAQAPQFYAQQFLPAQALAQVGAQREAIAGQPLQEAITRYNYAQQLPYQQLAGYMSSIYGNPLSGMTAAPQGNSALQNIGAGINLLASGVNLVGSAKQVFPQSTNWLSGIFGGR